MNVVGDVKRVTSLDCISDSTAYWQHSYCHYIFTFLSSVSSGEVFAEWSEGKKQAIWHYASEKSSCLRPPKIEKQLFKQNDLSCFRSIIARIGNAAIDDTYLGAGVFKIRFEGELEGNKRFAAFMANSREVGYWIKLQVL
jgi:hypothetical protein